MRQHYDAGCHGSMDVAGKCWGSHSHAQLLGNSRRYKPRRSLQHKRPARCQTAVERVGHETEVLLDTRFNGRIKLSAGSAAHLLCDANVESSDSLPTSTIINRRIKGATVLPELLEVIVEHGTDFNNANTSHAFNRLAKLYRSYGKPKRGEPRISPEDRQAVVAEYVEPAVSALTILTQCKLHEYESWDTATSLWAAAVLKLSNSPVVESLLMRASQLADSYMPADISNTVWACAKLQIRPEGLLKHLVPVSVEQMQLFKPSEVSILVWAYAKLDFHPGQDLLEAATDHVLQNLHLFPPQETATVMWAMGKLGYHNHAVHQGLEQHLLQLKLQLQPQDISDSLWSSAKLGMYSEAMMEELGALAMQKLGAFKAQELTNLVYAHAVLQHKNFDLLDSIAQRVLDRTADFSGRELVTILWSFGRLQYFPSQPNFMTVLTSWLVSERMALSPQALANLVKSLAKLKYCPDPLTMDLLAKRSIACISDFKPAELTNLLWGFASLGNHHEVLFDSAITQMQVWITTKQWRITTQHINSVLYSCELLGFCPRELVDLAESRGIRRLRIKRAAPSHLPLPASFAPTSTSYSSFAMAEEGRFSMHGDSTASSAPSTSANGVHQHPDHQSHMNGFHVPHTAAPEDAGSSAAHVNGYANGHSADLEGLPDGWNFDDFKVTEADPELADRIAHMNPSIADGVNGHHQHHHRSYAANGSRYPSRNRRTGQSRYYHEENASVAPSVTSADEFAAAGLTTSQDACISNIVLTDLGAAVVHQPRHVNGRSKSGVNGHGGTGNRADASATRPRPHEQRNQNITVH